MANPFKESENKAKAKPKTKEEEIVTVETKSEPARQENPLAGMLDPKPDGKSYGFYLSSEAVDKLEKLAKQNKCSKSKALDLLLRQLP